ncbi:MAG: hypothetical protein U9Q94_07805, partial [Candidatus Bipolaricaulota bacterium]|nr:hypothetical protein [Candidatus Bipolaricaulota bacterium]
GCVAKISEHYLVPVLKSLLAQYPFTIHGFHSDNGGEYLNFHRPCGFLSALRVRQAGATETVDEKGKIKKKYETYLTPFEKLQTLTKPEQFLKKG